MKPRVTLREALSRQDMLGHAIPGPSWELWRALLIAAMGEPLTGEERILFTAVTGREVEPLERVAELWCIVGRRGGKTRAAATLGVYVAALCDWRDVLGPGERGVLPLLGFVTDQADSLLAFAKGILERSSGLAKLVVHPVTADTLRLSTGVDLVVMPANFRTVRSFTAISAIADECAFWGIEGSRNPDAEIFSAIRPTLATTGGLLISITSPYARKGEVYRTFRRDYGPAGDVLTLVAKAPSRTFNPTLSQAEVDRAYRRDPVAASAEYGAQFRSDVETVFTREILEAAVEEGVRSRKRVAGTHYVAFTDPSGGSSDSMTLAIAHRHGNAAVVDATVEKKPPFSPESTVAEFAALLKSYGITAVYGDQYGGQFVQETFRRHSIEYRPSPIKSQLYLSLIGAANSARLVLLDDDRAIEQMVALERRTARGGRDTIDHPPGAHHDDLANCIAGAVWAAIGKRPVADASSLVGRRSAFANSSAYSGASSHG